MTRKYTHRSAAFRLAAVFLFVADGCDKNEDDADESAKTNDGADDGAASADDGGADGDEGTDQSSGESSGESESAGGTESSTGQPEPAECMKDCVTCGDVVMFLCDPANLCPASEPLFGDVFGCVCAEQCTDDCGANVCAGAQPSPECGGCIETSCAESFAACQADAG
jgi:hypothetical protein